MNTEQLKTAEELEQTLETICFSAYIHGKNQGDTFHGWYTESGHKSGIEKVVKDFASQESNRAVEKDRESRWISVEERLPEDGQMVLIQSTDNAMFPVVARYRKSHKLQFIIPYRSDLDVKNVTHWQPLPEVPKL